MGGGGFMQHASDTNRKDRAQRTARREKFQGNHSDKMILDSDRAQQIDFSHLTKDQITKERARIRSVFKNQRKKNLFIYGIAIVLVCFAGIWSYRWIFIH